MAEARPMAEVARTIAATVLSRDPGPMSAVPSLSHHVFAGSDVVVKVIEGGRHRRLDREVGLVERLPTGLTAPLLASGTERLGTSEFRYACYARVVGTAPGMGLPGVTATAARSLAEQAVERLLVLHAWQPPGVADRILREPLAHDGFVDRAGLLAAVGELGSDGRLAPPVLDGLAAIAAQAPPRARTGVPVHADCHWDNWLARDGQVLALLDFEWARWGEPLDDWFFLAAFSGPHLRTVLDVVAAATGLTPDELAAGCELREAAHLVSELRTGNPPPHRLRELDALTVGRRWWR
ncbi:phosphotransferase family protein [Actinocatenispora sera]|uniref:Aminoglycoside phosphotransferase domain-containing protein n=1 Tax=Actinocatenispora sera TaxID=390989 RepID=A0A810KZC0_9ACTN|nr:phosphotransferase [Actinocatenispora sera]BCJ27358.1 hypothetical protein Asera_14660 [Actinocatenispora sera]